MIKAVVFDCFGVIRPDKLLLTYQKFGGDIVTDKEFIHDTIMAAHHGMIPDTWSPFAERLGVSAEAWHRELNQGGTNDTQLLDYVAELRKDYKTGLLTNASKGHMLELIGAEDLGRCFDLVAESGAIGFAKPEAEAYAYVTDGLGVRADECVFTDDREEYCDGARAVGMQAIRYESLAQFRADLSNILQK